MLGKQGAKNVRKDNIKINLGKMPAKVVALVNIPIKRSKVRVETVNLVNTKLKIRLLEHRALILVLLLVVLETS